MKSPDISPPLSPSSFSNTSKPHRSARNRNASSLSISIPISPQRIPPLKSASFRRSLDVTSLAPDYTNSSATTTTTLHYEQPLEPIMSTPFLQDNAHLNSSYYYYENSKNPSNNFEVMPAENPYPNGPILVREPNIYLFSEPSLETAKQFDVIVNVAKEVANPFKTNHTVNNKTSETASRVGIKPIAPTQNLNTSFIKGPRSSSSSSSPSSSVSSSSSLGLSSSPSSSASATEDLCFSPTVGVVHSPPSSVNSNTSNLYDDESTSEDEEDDITLKKAVSDDESNDGSTETRSIPEYIYVPWDHTSKLTPDLGRLTDLISNRSAQGKKILIHCQCGVSRSASLVVAYIMRQDKSDLNTAYEYVKKKSPNISPNMTLMFQLIDWARILKQNPENPDLAIALGSTTSSPPSSYDDDLIPSTSSRYSLASPPPSTPLTSKINR